MTASATPARDLRDLRDLPKGHLHLHMEAAMRPETLTRLSQKLGIEEAPTGGFRGFTQFSETYLRLLQAMDHPDHLSILTDEIFADQAAQGVAYVELGVSPAYYARQYGTVEAALDEMISVARAASAIHGVAFGLMPTIDRTRGIDNAMAVARAAAARAGDGVVSLGLAAEERGHPAGDFTEPFALAKAAGLQSTPHAGELVGPESIRDALDALHADRILHGVRAVEDPALVAELAERGIPLDVCPTSNLLLEVIDDMAAHPLVDLLDAGVRCSINADDPILFGPDILDEYELCRRELLVGHAELAACAWTSIETTLADDVTKQKAASAIDAWLA